MKSRTGGLRSGLLVLFTALSLMLAVAGNLLGNVVAERVPILLALAVVCYLVVTISLNHMQDICAHLRTSASAIGAKP